VRRATNVTAAEAKRRGLVDVIASSEQDLLRKLDGFRVEGPKRQVLETSGARIVRRAVPFKFQILELIVNPTTAYLLFILALFGIGFELFHPGAILPGTIGGVSLILALFGFAQLPLNIAGVLLILLAFGLLVAEAFVVSHGALAAGGITSLVFGGLLLFDTDSDAFEISVPVVIFTGALLGGFFVWIISKAVQTRHRRVHTGTEELVGERAIIRSRLNPVGHVFLHGALWRATGANSTSFEVGDEVVVEKVDGLTLTVRKPENGF
jgi:membrane-bound serine protease (ClpP class)